MKKDECIARIKKGLKCSDEEAEQIFEYDQRVEHNQPTEYDISPEKQKVAQTYARTGTRKTPTVYQFSKRERKPNATKGGIIAELSAFFESQSEFSITNLQIANPERQISFEVGGEKFELTLVQKRKPK